MRPQQLHNLKTRSLVIHHTRDFFLGHDFLEVETPIRCPSIIPEAHIDPLLSEGQYLQASPELCMKRLLSRNLQKIFQICKCFRKNEQGPFHLPEHTLLEWYDTKATYLDLMDQCQGLLRHIAEKLGLGTALIYQDQVIDLSPPFDRITVEQAFDTHGSKPALKALEDGSFDELMGFEVEPCLGQERPCILYDYPAPMASLAKLKPDDEKLAQRFELYVAGIELANGFTELNDPILQRQRFVLENQIRSDRGQSSLPLPEKFLTDLKTMPDAAGIALGVDRMVMLFCNATTIDEVVAFVPETL